MLCCVPKRLADGGPFHDETPFPNEVRFHEAPFHDEALNRLTSIREIRLELYAEEDAPSPILLPCAICARTFMPQSLEKHARICERAASKKRKPFDSAKQRIQGTELAEFLPKQETRRYHQDDRNIRSSWKKTHDDFLRTIREARGEVMDLGKQCNSLISSGAPTRANEKGMCPTCNRHFGIKAYDRHVAWCKDRVTQVPVSPATNLAKERLEARMRYKAPTLKNRRAINREKYSPGSAANQTAKTSQSSPALVKPKESTSMTNCGRESLIKQKSTVVRRPGQLKESPTPSGPMKSRLVDRINRPMEDHDSLLTPTSSRSSHFAISSRRSLPFSIPSVSLRINDPISSNEITSPTISFKKQSDRNKTTPQRVLNDKMNIREACSARTSKNIVSARSQGHPRINDIAVNDKSLGMTVQPCRIQADVPKDDQLVTWKQISRKKDSFQANHNFSQEFQLDLDLTVESKKSLSIAKNFVRTDDEVKDDEMDKVENDVTWLSGFQNLNQTYLIRDSLDDFDQLEIFHSNWKPIKHSPRVEFYFMNKENEDIKIAEREVEELQMNTNSKIIEHKIGESQINNKNNWKINDFKESEEIKCKIEELNTEDEDKEINQETSDKKAKIKEHNMKKIEMELEIELKNKKDIPKMDDVNLAKLDKLNINEEDNKDQQTMMDDESTKYHEIKEIEQNLFNFDETKLLQDTLQEYEKPSSKELKKSTDNDNFLLDKKSPCSKRKEHTAVHVDRRLAFSDSFISQSQNYPRLKKKISQYKNDTCCSNSLELKKNMTTCIYHRFDKNNIFFNKNEIDCNLNPESEVFLYQNNICRNSSDLQKNAETSPSVLCKVDSTKRSFAEETENYERYENDLIIFDDRKSQKSLEESKNSEISSSQNSKVVVENCLNVYMDNKLQIETNRKHQEKLLNSENFENIEKDKKTDFNANADNCLNNKTRFYNRLVAKTVNESLRMKGINNDFAYDNDNDMHEKHNTQGANDLESSITSKDDIEKPLRHRDGILSKSVKFFEHVSSPTKRAIKERVINNSEIKHKIQESMNLLRGSTDSLISSVEFVELASIEQPETNCAYKREIIEIIRPSRRSRALQNLPDIRHDSAKMREAAERNSYWEKASKISRSRLIGLDSLYPYRLTRRNPRTHILPPVPNPSLINRRKNDLATRPAWCSYVHRRPDFNLVLKARTGTCKDYDPFLLAEQQMNDLLSDTSDQSATGNAKQTRDILYPLSHSSAFVKYPSSDRRSSLIAPPSEFDDLFSNFSSDSTETNSISHEVFLKPEVLANSKDVTDLASTKPVKELSRRVIIDKSKALGIVERRGALGSADRTRKALDKVSPKVTRSFINRSNSIRASSAPRTGSGADRKTSVDIRKDQNSKLAEGQRSSDQTFNQRNNNYSSLSGSNLSLSSIISSELDVKRSHSMFDELTTSFEEDTFPDFRSFLNNESFNLSSSMHDGDRQRNDSLVSDEELSSPDSYKPQDHSKLSNDSAYSSLNRKYSHHGRSTNDVASRLDEDVSRNGTSPIQTAIKYKMSKFCHECGQRFPETAKFCCECGVRRLAL